LAKVLDENVFGFWARMIEHSFDLTFNQVDEKKHQELLSRSLEGEKVGLYIHFPFCKSFCLYCPYYKEIWSERAFTRYVDALHGEIELLSKTLEGKEFEVVDAHVGGGSPSLADPSFWRRVIEELRSGLGLKVKLGIEANPEDLADESKAFRLADAGVSEISIGGQSFHEAHLKALGRRYAAKEAETAVNNCRAAGFKLINLDLMFAIPNVPGELQLKNWEEDLERAVQLNPHQITVYPTLITPQCVGFRLIEQGKVVQPVNLFGSFLKVAKNALEDDGYRMVRIESWTKDGDYVTVNLEMVGPLLALGPGAMGFTGSYEWANTHSIAEYVEAVKSGKLPAVVSRIVDQRERAARLMADQLFCRGEVSEETFRSILGLGFDAIPKGIVRSLMFMRILGWVERENRRLRLTNRGFIPAHKFVWTFVLKVPCKIAEQLVKTPKPSKIKVP
jgi:oxygen-independent coproporphyrinogen-3 oxidase